VLAGSISLSLLSPNAGAQEASPPPEEVLPLEGVSFDLLGGGEPAAAPGQSLAFVRMTIEPGGFISAHGHPGAQIWFVEAGAFSTTVSEGTLWVMRVNDEGTLGPAEPLTAGDEATLSPGDSAFFDADVVHTVHHANGDSVVVLISALLETGQEPIIFHAAHHEATPNA
jgi:quercetin dioxygenase-like cupin family protein